MVVTYDPDAVDLSGLLVLSRQAGISLEFPAQGSGPSAGPMALGCPVSEVAAHANRGVAQITGGTIDLRLLLPFGLGALAVREIVAGRGLVPIPWYTALWYSYSLFSKFNKPSGADSTSGE